MVKKEPILFSILVLLLQCKPPPIELAQTVDPDIILINIENGDRTYLGNLLLKVETYKPKVVGIDVYFKGEKGQIQDSTLVRAFKKMQNDILIYHIDQNNKYSGSDPIFSSLAEDVGYMHFELNDGEVIDMTPLKRVNGRTQESFALKIVNHWLPEYNVPIRIDQTIPIHYTRTLSKYLNLAGSDLLNGDVDESRLENKIILIGYTGPGQEDKYYTPLGEISDDYKKGQPDTYGLVIIANQIRTILEFRK